MRVSELQSHIFSPLARSNMFSSKTYPDDQGQVLIATDIDQRSVVRRTVNIRSVFLSWEIVVYDRRQPRGENKPFKLLKNKTENQYIMAIQVANSFDLQKEVCKNIDLEPYGCDSICSAVKQRH